MSEITPAKAIESLRKDIDINKRMLVGLMGTLDQEAKAIVETSIKGYEKAIEALEKQIPEKVTLNKAGEESVFTEIYYSCKCGEIYNRKNQNYCGRCGQKLDWSEANE